ncbi:hypothetical protein ACFLRV_00165 [Candidatus Bipolaricaulota bacterium]
MSIPTGVWTQLQKAETLLVHAGRSSRPELARRVSEDFPLEGLDRVYLTRFFSGFDPTCIKASDYHVRYPFSTVEAIEQILLRLSEKGILVPSEDGFALTQSGTEIAMRWLENAGTLLADLGGDRISEADVVALIEHDQRILRSLAEPSNELTTPILRHRSLGMQPEYDPPRLWHHWQLVWSMLAGAEDAQEHVRKAMEIGPLEWFIGRQLWFVERRPWRARAVRSSLYSIANRYAPVGEDDCLAAWSSLQADGWTDGDYDTPKLSVWGFERRDEIEENVNRIFLSCWPKLSGSELAELTDLTSRLNRHLEEVMERCKQEVS